MERAIADLTPRACQCSFCTKHGATYLADPAGRAVLTTSGLAQDVYCFGLGITDFHICGQCGVLVAASWRSGEAIFAVVNMRALHFSSSITTAVCIADYDGEDVAAREIRRRANWTPASIRQLR